MFDLSPFPGQSGLYVLEASISGFDPERTRVYHAHWNEHAGCPRFGPEGDFASRGGVERQARLRGRLHTGQSFFVTFMVQPQYRAALPFIMSRMTAFPKARAALSSRSAMRPVSSRRLPSLL